MAVFIDPIWAMPMWVDSVASPIQDTDQITMPINALVLLDGVLSHGHQSRGLVRELARETAVTTQEFFVQMHSSWMRGYLRKALAMSSEQTLSWAGHCFNWPQEQITPPDLIVSAGEETMLFNAVLARRYGCDNIFIGRQQGVRSSWFSAVVTLDSPVLANALSINLPPSRLTPESASQAFAAYVDEGGDGRDMFWAMIIGGNKADCRYAEEDWLDLAHGMNVLAKAHKIKWLVLTTRLTDVSVEKLLLNALQERYLESISSFSFCLDDPLPLLAGRASRIYCGYELLPMLFDMIASGRVTVAYTPQHEKPNRQVSQLLSSLRQERLVSVISSNELPTARMVRPARPLPDLLLRKQQQMFEQLRSYCPSLANATQGN